MEHFKDKSDKELRSTICPGFHLQPITDRICENGLEMSPEHIVFSYFQRDILSFRKEWPICAIVSFSTNQ